MNSKSSKKALKETEADVFLTINSEMFGNSQKGGGAVETMTDYSPEEMIDMIKQLNDYINELEGILSNYKVMIDTYKEEQQTLNDIITDHKEQLQARNDQIKESEDIINDYKAQIEKNMQKRYNLPSTISERIKTLSNRSNSERIDSLKSEFVNQIRQNKIR